MAKIPTRLLASTEIPVIDYGTAEYPFGSNSKIMKESVLHAIKVGYRLLDTASLYQSEQPLGDAIAEAISCGFIKSRDELFISSKLWCTDGHKELVLPALQQTLKWKLTQIWQQKKAEYCDEKGIHIVGYSPLGAKGTLWGSNKVLESDVLKQIALAKGKSVAQICLRWVYEQGVTMLVKSFNKERIQENVGIFDWELSPAESQKTSEIPQHKGCLGLEFISQNGPFKSLADTWDEEA